MDENAEVERIEREKRELLKEATRMVQVAEMAGRALNAGEDARTLALIARVRVLEEKLERWRRHHRDDNQMQS
jgi:hypothetical protein